MDGGWGCGQEPNRERRTNQNFTVMVRDGALSTVHGLLGVKRLSLSSACWAGCLCCALLFVLALSKPLSF